MKKILKILFILGLFFMCQSSFAADESIQIIKNDLYKEEKVLTFKTKNINAIYPYSSYNPIGNNYPGHRGPGQLVLYFPEYGKTTQTNEFGAEAVVVEDTVVKLTGADSIIPNNGFVISGHGSSKSWIKANLKTGTKIKISNNTLIAYTTPDSFVYHAKERIAEAQSFIETSSKKDKRALFYLKKAKSEYKKAKDADGELKISLAKSCVSMSNLAIKYALPYDENEFKGVWLRPTETNVFEVANTLDEIKATGINDVFLETYYHGMTIYPSNVMKRYKLTVQNPKFYMFDPLKAYVTEAHKRGMKIHCWFESFYIGNQNPLFDVRSILSVYPDWQNKNLANYDKEGYVSHPTEHNGYFLDPSNPQVISFLIDILDEITTFYKVDGINLDYIRYPNSSKSNSASYEASNWGYTEFARNEFMQMYEIDPIEIKAGTVLWKKWSEYRCNKIYQYLLKANMVLRNKKVFISAVVFPNYDTCLETKQQDWAKWTKDGLVDAVTPLIMTSDNELFYKILKDVKNRVQGETKVFTGLFTGFMDAEPEDLLKQISTSRGLEAQGIILFDWAHLQSKYRNALRQRVFLPDKK